MALVAELEGEIVGHVMISGARLHHSEGDRSIALLSPLAVAPDRHKSRIGAALVEAVVAVADQRGVPMVVLEGDPGYYGRMGFEPSAGYGITMPLPDWAPRQPRYGA
ncbi:MAG: GNAT family N-acetyltransferase [Acidimicrobiales bacterium]